ncbi:PIR protein [Plasmodium yoelii]|uniref:PIR protein n=2 Tax=Plasmodium yoelii TaxID=5861 RepID=A0AAE9WSR4_PLAYO|nr:PIR protein [Plasmodium yoelii]WBY55879.1 PIR protein [Plasmodium yoelii yoelii]CDU16874.1 YIR protein [Plasmodium yoelii]VTZ75124.1 PIR protein [Plasmodium yoelii]|eukprot:XP_022813112.1 PIR protein [Plasmodium yoelii]
MDKDVCKKFHDVRKWFPDQLDDKKMYQFKDDTHFKKYCTGDRCDTDFDKINAGCLYFFDTFFKDILAFETAAKRNIYIVEYILIWLSYMLSLKSHEGITNLNDFYDKYIKDGDKYTNNIDYIVGYNGYKDLIDSYYFLLSVDTSIMSKLYDAFNTLCDMYNELYINNSNCAEYSEKANQFVEKCKGFNIDYNTSEEIPYLHVLLTLLDGYDNLKNKCRDFPSIPGAPNKNYEDISEVTSSSSIASKLIPILSILVAIAIFLGISYKYSLFGFRKRFQKQKLREKLKNIKKRMGH